MCREPALGFGRGGGVEAHCEADAGLVGVGGGGFSPDLDADVFVGFVAREREFGDDVVVDELPTGEGIHEFGEVVFAAEGEQGHTGAFDDLLEVRDRVLNLRAVFGFVLHSTHVGFVVWRYEA